MAGSEQFTIIDHSNNDDNPRLFDSFKDFTSGKLADIDVQISTALRSQYPDLIVTTVFSQNVDLFAFASAGHAAIEVDTETESIVRLRGYILPRTKGGPGLLGDGITFAKFHYVWANEDFIVYLVAVGFGFLQYVLKEIQDGETQLSNSKITDALIKAAGSFQYNSENSVLVFDNFRWYKDPALYQEVLNASWDKVILDEGMKR